MIRKSFVILAAIFFTTAGVAADQIAASESAPARKLAVIRLTGKIAESPPMLDLGLGDLPTGTLRSWTDRIRNVTKDQNIVGLLLLIDQPIMGWAQMQDLRDALDAVRQSGKKVYCHALTLDSLEYMLACAADQIAMAEGGDLYTTGLAAQVLFFKDLLDKIGIQADVEHVGRYKLVGEPYTSTQPSPFMNRQINRLLDSSYQTMIETIADGRNMTAEQVQDIIDTGPRMAGKALQAGLIDQVVGREDYLAQLADNVSAIVLRDYGKSKPPRAEGGLMGLMKMFSMLAGTRQDVGKPTIAIVYAEGMITMGSSSEVFGSRTAGSYSINKAIRQITEDSNIKAVVLRIDSPGGSAAASDAIWQQLSGLAHLKPVVVSMGNVAASGGYYIACPAEAIFVQPATITGSIGIVGGKLVAGKLLDMIGINCATYTRGKNAELWRFDQPFTDEQRKTVRSLMLDAYQLFKRRVTSGRADRLKVNDLEKLAGGRVYTGSEAVDLGLADRIGGLDAAVEYAANLAHVKTYKIRTMPEPKTIMDLILESLGYQSEALAGFAIADKALAYQHLLLTGTDKPTTSLRNLLLMADQLAKHATLAVMPYSIIIK